MFSRFLVTLSLVAFATTLYGQASRTWVSGVGDDFNPCSRTAPCKTFAGAISKTADKGEISVLDPGGYGAVTITKSITIDGTGTDASILSSSVNGVVVNDSLTATPNTAEVVLRNISINGFANGLDGVRFISGKSLTLDGVRIANLTGDGLDVATNTAVNTYVAVRDTVIENINGIGLRFSPLGAGTLFVTVDRTRVFRSRTTSASFFNGNVKGHVSDSDFSGCPVGAGVTIAGTAEVSLDHVRATSNNWGVYNYSGSPTTRLKDCLLVGNTLNGALVSAGSITAYDSNVITNPSGVITAMPQ